MEENNTERAKGEKISFLKGIAFGVLVTVSLILGGKSLYNIMGYYLGGEAAMESKAKVIYSLLDKKYVAPMDREKFYEGVYAGMVYGAADKYSTYIPASAYNDYKQKTSGEYVGIGIVVTVNEKGEMVVKHVLEGSRAEEEGITPGDLVLAVNGTEFDRYNYYDLVEMVKGEPGTKVKIKFYRPAEELTLEKEIERVKVDTPTVTRAMLEGDMGYIRISAFDGVTYDQFKTALEALKGQNMKKLVLDLRDNSGGLLTSVTAVLDEFLDEGVITYMEDRNGKKTYEYSKAGGYEIPIAILINGSSASAAELCTAALKDRAGAVLIGENTYGKGVVQSTFPLKDGSAVKLTTSRYYTPNGVCIDGKGIAPDYKVEAMPGFQMPYVDKSKAEFVENDVQLDKAVEVLKNK